MTTFEKPFFSSPSYDAPDTLTSLPTHLLGEVASYLPPADAVRLSRTSPFISARPMREAIESVRVDFLNECRIPQALSCLAKKLLRNSAATLPQWMLENPLKSEHQMNLTFDPTTPEHVNHLSGHATMPSSLDCVATANFTPNGSVVSGGHDGHIRYWQKDASGAWQSQVLYGHGRPVDTVATNATGTQMLSASWGEGILLHSCTPEGNWTHQMLDRTADRRFHYHTHPDAWFSPGGQFAITDPVSPATKHLHALSVPPSRFASGNARDYMHAVFSKDDKQVFLVPRESTRNADIQWWHQQADGSWVSAALSGHGSPPNVLLLSPNDAYLLSQDTYETIIWGKDNQGAWQPHLTIQGSLYGVQFSPDGQSLLGRPNISGAVCLWQLNAIENAPAEFEGFSWLTSGMGFSPDGTSFYIAGCNHRTGPGNEHYTVKIFSKCADGGWALRNTLDYENIYAPSLVMSPDRQHILLKGQEFAADLLVGGPRLILYNQGIENMSGPGQLLRGTDWVAERATVNADGSSLVIIDNHGQLRVLNKAKSFSPL